MTRYLLLIDADEAPWEALSPDERQPSDERCSSLARDMEERGHALGGDELTPAARPARGGPRALQPTKNGSERAFLQRRIAEA